MRWLGTSGRWVPTTDASGSCGRSTAGTLLGTVWSPGPYTARAISQYGFHGTPPPPDAFIDTLVAIAEDDAPRDGVVEGREWRDADD